MFDWRRTAPVKTIRTMREEIEAVERAKIIQVLKLTDGDITRAAFALDLARNTLLERLNRYQISAGNPKRHKAA